MNHNCKQSRSVDNPFEVEDRLPYIHILQDVLFTIYHMKNENELLSHLTFTPWTMKMN